MIVISVDPVLGAFDFSCPGGFSWSVPAVRVPWLVFRVGFFVDGFASLSVLPRSLFGVSCWSAEFLPVA